MVRSLLQGAGAFVVSAGMFLGAVRLGLAESVIRSMTFATLIVANLALIFTNRRRPLCSC